MAAAHRVVVTGVGMVTSLGATTASTMRALMAGERGHAELSVFSHEGYANKLVCEARGLFEALRGRQGREAAGLSRSDALALLSAHEALVGGARLGQASTIDLVVAASTGGMLETEIPLTKAHLGLVEGVDVASMRCHPISAPADAVFDALGPFRSRVTVCAACSGGAVALGLAISRLRLGESECVLAGGVDALSRLTFAGFSALGAIDPGPCRPFDRERRGLNLGEGAAFLLLERDDVARARGAAVIAELGGYAVLSEAFHITQPDPSGERAAEVMRRALADAGIAPSRVGYVNAHGTGTPLNDPTEAQAISMVLGERAASVPVSSQKGQLGHTLSAAGAIEAAVTALAMGRGEVPANGGLEQVDEQISLRLVGAVGERASFDAAISSSFGFGGTDACVAVAAEGVGEPSAAPPAFELWVTGAATLGPLDALGAAAYTDPSREADVASGGADPKGTLDASAARRLDRPSRCVVHLTLAALRQAGVVDTSAVGVVAGCAFGSSDEAASFSGRVLTKGPRFAPPLDFPNLVPSSPGAHASIVCKLRGPSLSVADLATSALSSLHAASLLLRDGRARAMVSVASEAPSTIAERWLSPSFSLVREGPRGHGGGALVVEPRHEAEARGARPLARLDAVAVWPEGGATAAVAAPTSPRAEILAPFDDVAPLAARLGWGAVPVSVVGPRAGWHEGALAIALSSAAARIAAGLCDEVLVLGRGAGREGLARLSAVR